MILELLVDPGLVSQNYESSTCKNENKILHLYWILTLEGTQ